MRWLGDGQTYNEKMMKGDRMLPNPHLTLDTLLMRTRLLGAWFLNDDEIDVPPGTPKTAP